MRYLLICFVVIFMVSCQKVIDVKAPNEKQKLVINSFFSEDSTWNVHLSKSQYILDNNTDLKVSDGKITIIGSDGSNTEFTHKKDGYYTSTAKPKLGIDYVIKAEAKDFDNAEAQSSLPVRIPILSVDTLRVNSPNGNSMQLSITFQDLPQQVNYYNIALKGAYYQYIYDTVTYSIIDSALVYENIWFEPNDKSFLSSYSGYMIAEDVTFNGQQYSLKIKVSDYYFGNNYGYGNNYEKILIILNHVSADYGKYLKSYSKYLETNGDPFAEPVKVYTNVNNGFGIFAGYSGSTYELKLK